MASDSSRISAAVGVLCVSLCPVRRRSPLPDSSPFIGYRSPSTFATVAYVGRAFLTGFIAVAAAALVLLQDRVNSDAFHLRLGHGTLVALQRCCVLRHRTAACCLTSGCNGPDSSYGSVDTLNYQLGVFKWVPLDHAPRPRYSEHFCATAVGLSQLPASRSGDVAESLYIHPFMLSRWRKERARARSWRRRWSSMRT